MNKLYLILLFTVAACGENSSANKDQTNTKSQNIGSAMATDGQERITFSEWPDVVREKVEPIVDYVIERNSGSYDCQDIGKYINQETGKVGTDQLTAIDSVMCQRLFGDYQHHMSTFKYGYLNSIEKPIHRFYPITVIQYFGATDQPMVMILYDANGQIVNSITVANYYGELGGCMSSEFINDSTLIQRDEWNNIESDSNGNEFWTKTVVNRELVVHSTGQVTEKEIARRTTKD